MFSNPSHRNFMKLLNDYYDSPLLQKVKYANGVSIYMCKLSSLLLHEKRFLIVTVKENDNLPIGQQFPLKELSWTSFQTRVLDSDEYEEIVIHSYVLKREPNFNMIRVKATEEYSVYKDEQRKLPIELTLLHINRNRFEYPERGTLISCLETFQTIIQLD